MASRAIPAKDLDEQIRALAHKLWEEDGRPEGRAEEHWMKAREMLGEKAARPAKARKSPSSPRPRKA